MSLSLDLSQQDLAILCAHLPVGVTIHQEGKIIFVNPALLAMLGYADGADLIGTDPSDLVHPEERLHVLERIRRNALGQLNPPMEERLRRRDGSYASVEVSALPVTCGGRSAVLVLMNDLSVRKAMEDDLRQAQKMEAIGRLAGGVSHDFNNVLMVIMGNCQLLMERSIGQPEAVERLDEILRACESAAEITRQLLTFSRRHAPSKVALDVNHQARQTKRMLGRLLSEQIQLYLDLDAGNAWVSADPSHIEQILINLSINARDAMPKGGELQISTHEAAIGHSGPDGTLSLDPGPYVVLSVRDSGSGMSEAVSKRIFEPFFTTKGLGKGTGLGLATVFGIVKGAGGAIRVTSAPGQGSLFEVYLPQLPAEAIPVRAPAAPIARSLRGQENILLVEDEESLRLTLSMALNDQGYRVLEAKDGEQALELVAAMGAVPAAVISDMVMPGMNGLELVRALRRDFGMERALLISGYADPALFGDYSLVPRESVFRKPMRLERLLGRLREVLDGIKP